MKKKLKLANTTWEMIRIKSDTKAKIGSLKYQMNLLTFDDVIRFLLNQNQK